jgi:hypothetical protein
MGRSGQYNGQQENKGGFHLRLVMGSMNEGKG